MHSGWQGVQINSWLAHIWEWCTVFGLGCHALLVGGCKGVLCEKRLGMPHAGHSQFQTAPMDSLQGTAEPLCQVSPLEKMYFKILHSMGGGRGGRQDGGGGVVWSNPADTKVLMKEKSGEVLQVLENRFPLQPMKTTIVKQVFPCSLQREPCQHRCSVLQVTKELTLPILSKTDSLLFFQNNSLNPFYWHHSRTRWIAGWGTANAGFYGPDAAGELPWWKAPHQEDPPVSPGLLMFCPVRAQTLEAQFTHSLSPEAMLCKTNFKTFCLPAAFCQMGSKKSEKILSTANQKKALWNFGVEERHSVPLLF